MGDRFVCGGNNRRDRRSRRIYPAKNLARRSGARDGVWVGFRAAYWNDPWIVGWAARCGLARPGGRLIDSGGSCGISASLFRLRFWGFWARGS